MTTGRRARSMSSPWGGACSTPALSPAGPSTSADLCACSSAQPTSRRFKTRTAWQVALDTAQLRLQEERVDEYRGNLERIFEAAGERNIDSLVARYARREGTNFRAFCALNQLCGDVEELLHVRAP